jgi:flagellar protein FliL
LHCKERLRVASKDDQAEAPEGGEDGAAPKKKGPPKLVIIIAAAAVLVLGGGGAAAFFLLKPKPAEAGHGEAPEKEKKKEKKKEEKKEGEGGGDKAAAGKIRQGPEGIIFYTMPDVVVNMQTPDGRPTFLKLKLTLELPDSELAETLDIDLPRLQDMLQTFLRELRPEDLSGSQGSYQLRMEILRRINLLIAPDKVNAVLLEEMLIN